MFFERHMCQKGELDMSNFKEGQVHQFMNALEEAGFTPEHVTKLGQSENLGGILKVLNGHSKITQIIFRCIRRIQIAGTSAGTLRAASVQKIFLGSRIPASLYSWISQAAGETIILVNKVMLNGVNIYDLFGSTASELNKNCLQWAQVASVCWEYDHIVKKNDARSLFLITGNGNPVEDDLSNAFIVSVIAGLDNRLYPYLCKFTEYDKKNSIPGLFNDLFFIPEPKKQ